MGNQTWEVRLVVTNFAEEDDEVAVFLVSGDGWNTTAFELCGLGGTCCLVGTWKATWYDAETGEEVGKVTAEVKLAAAQAAPTRPAAPRPGLPPAWQVSGPVGSYQPAACLAGAEKWVEVGIRNQDGQAGERRSVRVHVSNPAGRTSDLGTVTVQGDNWAMSRFELCQRCGPTALAGTWTVRGSDTASEARLAELAFAVGLVQGGAPAPPAATGDSDGDGLTDDERSLGTDPSNSGSAGDQLTDGFEVWTYGTDRREEDTDWDGTGDGAESVLGSDSFDPCDANPMLRPAWLRTHRCLRSVP